MRSAPEDIIDLLCKDEDWEGMDQKTFQRKMGASVTFLLRRSVHTYWLHMGLVTLGSFLGGACVWIALIIASAKDILG